MSSTAVPVHVALVDMSGTIEALELAEVAGALNEQVQADIAPAWKVAATVGAYPSAPPGTWRIELHETIDLKNAAGYHADKLGQPYAKVVCDGGWTVTASHELVEMLVDPFGSRLHTAAALKGWKGSSPRVWYLWEPGDPVEEVQYEVGGVPMTDFVLPPFYRSTPRGSLAAYSHTGAATEPLQILEGGYISFIDPATETAWQRFVHNGQIVDKELPPPEGRILNLREYFDEHARAYRASLS
ncbi:MAG TPA: hypothetical protein VHR65_01900 [Solirubrobacterales bacterium]|jgi:hypothetical protein|nr:hypothetical protein [Solirubrobacterales bacterium]